MSGTTNSPSPATKQTKSTPYSTAIDLIKAAADAGVQELEFRDLKVRFWNPVDPHNANSSVYDHGMLTDTKQDLQYSTRSVPLDTSRKELNDLALEEKGLLREFELNQLMLNDPEKFEEMVETE